MRDQTIEDTWQRVARALAANEVNKVNWQDAFLKALQSFSFLPGGRILANAGTTHRATLLNCFVMGTLGDSMEGIFEGLKEGALTMQQGGGVGYDFSPLRPKGFLAHATGRVASGPVSFMRIWNTMCATILTVGARRGAMMATLRCDHPDIEDFITAKSFSGELKHFNLSVLVTDAFMQAVEKDEMWLLVFPVEKGDDAAGEYVERRWSGQSEVTRCRVCRKIRARDLWKKILKQTYEYSEPGVLFIDRINQQNNLWYDEQITATNPCGEIPLPPYGACNLGSVNLTQFILDPFRSSAAFDFAKLQSMIGVYVRMLDNVLDISHYPLGQQRAQVLKARRIGLGLTGLGDALTMLNLNYGDDKACEWASSVMKMICHEAYRASIQLAQEKGSFPQFDRAKFLEGAFVQTLPLDIQQGIFDFGLRNSHLTAIAPTGTISLLANNVSSGIEPIFATEYSRKILQQNDRFKDYVVRDFARQIWEEVYPGAPMPQHMVTAYDLSPKVHLKMQAALQPYVDNSISKTINVPKALSFDDFAMVYDWAFKLNLKGCTTYRESDVRGSVLSSGPS